MRAFDDTARRGLYDGDCVMQLSTKLLIGLGHYTNAAIETVVQKQAEEQQKVVTRYLTRFVDRAAEERVVYRDIVKVMSEAVGRRS